MSQQQNSGTPTAAASQADIDIIAAADAASKLTTVDEHEKRQRMGKREECTRCCLLIDPVTGAT